MPATLDDLADDPAMNGTAGAGRPMPGRGVSGCKHPIVSIMTLSEPTSTSPDLDATALRRAITPRKRDLQRCFEQVACPRLFDYAMRVTFTILPDGSAGDPQARTGNASIKQCMEAILASLRLPATGGATTDVTYTLTFRTSL